MTVDDKFTWTDHFDTFFAHPLLSYYGPADPPWHPILVIGQESHTDQRMGRHAGPYDLPAGKRTTSGS